MSEATVTFGAKDKNLKSTIKGINREMGGMGKTTKATAKSVNLSFAAMAKAGAALAVGVGVMKGAFALARKTVISFKEAIDLGGELSDLKEQTGVAAGEMLILRRAFDNSGVGADKAGTAINKMQKAIVDAGAGLTTQVRAFDRMGLSLEEIRKLSPEEQFNTIGKALADMKDTTERAATSMDIFGRSGGKMLALFNNFDDEMKTASDQLGLMPAIMSKMSDQFDKISDKIGVIRGKFVEFAAGVLSRVAPLLDLITEGLARFDAAAAGVKLADIFVGAGVAMEGFQTALDAFKIGEFSLTMKAAAASIKLQFAETANSIFANFKGAFSGLKAFILQAMGPGSAIYTIIKAQFKILGNELAAAIGGGLLAMVKDSTMFSGLAKNIRENLESISREIKNSKNQIANSMGEIPGDMKRAAEAGKAGFREGFANAGELIDTGKLNAELDAIQKQIAAKMADAAASSLPLNGDGLGSLQLEIGKERVSMAERLLELESDIATAKANGNGEEVAQLKATQKYYQALEKAKKSGLSMDKAMVLAGKDYAASIKGATNVLEKQANAAKKVREELGFAAKLAERIAGKQNETRGDGALKAKAEKQLGEGNFAAARRTQRRLAERERETELRGEGDKRDKRHLKDIAKEEGIDTFGKNNKEIRKEIMDKRKEKAEKEEKIEEKKKGKVEKPAEKAKENKLEKLAGDIFTELKSIGKKLPTHALGV